MNQPIRTAPVCYYSTPEHQRSLFGRFIYIYKGKGALSLSATELYFICKGLATSIPIRSIVDLRIGSFSRWAKPLGLDYLAVSFEDHGAIRTLHFIPTISAFTPTPQTNRIVREWFDLLTAVRQGRMPDVARVLI